MAEVDDPPPPEGFKLSRRNSPLSQRLGPLYYRPGLETGAEQAFLAAEHHTNQLGIVHGGMLSFFLDGLMVTAVAEKLQRPPATIHLSMDFLSVAKPGLWVLGEARMTHSTESLAYAEARAWSGERDLARATAVFKLTRRHL